MNWIREVFRRREADRDLRREMAAHLAERVDDLVENGTPEAEARRRAHVEFGNLTVRAEDARAVWIAPSLEGVWRDAAYALRGLRRQPAFTFGAVAILGVGIGLVTTFFTIVDATLMRPWPVGDPASLVIIRGNPPPDRPFGSVSPPECRYFNEHSQTFSHVAMWLRGGGPLTTAGGAALGTPQSNYVSANYFDVLRVGLGAGRGLTADDDALGAAKPVAVISDRLWKSRFNSDLSAVGSTVHFYNKPFVIVGVAEQGFVGTEGTIGVDVWLPFGAQDILFPPPSGRSPTSDARGGLTGCAGRLRAGVTRAQANTELNLLSTEFRRTVPMPAFGVFFTGTRPLDADWSTIQQQLPQLVAVLTGLLMVLLLACANVGNLILARGLAREREIGIRLAMGASRGRVIRQLMTESFVLALLSAAVALVIASLAPVVTWRMLQGSIQRSDVFSIVPTVLVFSVAVTVALLVAMLTGLAPALRVTHIGGSAGEGQRATAAKSGSRLRTLLLAAQVAVTTVLLVVAGLLGRTAARSSSVDVGFPIEGLQTISIQVPRDTSPERRRAMMAELQRSAVASGQPMAFASTPLLGESSPESSFRLPGTDRELSRRMAARRVSSQYFVVTGIQLVAGRAANDGARDELVVSESAARLLWADQSPLGRTLVQRQSDADAFATVVGVAADVATTSLRERTPTVYQSEQGAAQLVLVRNASPQVLEHVNGLVRSALPGSRVTAQPAVESVANLMREAMFASRIAWGIGALALTLATIGAFGVFAYVVEERRREIGVRMALGAHGADVVRLLVRSAGRPLAFGLGAGLVLALCATPVLRTMLYGLSPFDPMAYVQIGAVLGGAALVATWAPARRATRVDPATVLKAE